MTKVAFAVNVKPRNVDVQTSVKSRPSQTEQLANWISQVRCKKLMCRRNRKRNLRVEAVLTCALSKAERELRNKQLSRVSKWQQVKKQLAKDPNYSNFVQLYGDEDVKTSYHREKNLWQEPLCPALSSLDDFMLQLGAVKVPHQR